jgi:ABC-2 type transport system ATP-binding protein
MPNAIEIQDLAKDHAGEKALRGLSIHVPDPCLFGIIGADGAGKSTLMNILATLTDPDSGKARVLGHDLATRFQDIRADIGYMPQRFSLYQDLSVLENLDFFAEIFGITGREKKDRTDHLLEFAGLKSFTGRRAGLLSGGMKQKLALACTLIHHPKLLLLDEPTVGVDPVARRDFWKMLKSLRAEGITMVVSTPYMDEAALCDQLILLHEGALLAQGTPDQLLSQYPYRLYRIDGAEASGANGSSTLTYPGDRPPPPGFELIYPSGGALHAAEAKPKPGAGSGASPFGDPLTRIRTAVPNAASAIPIEASLEDYFFALLLGKNA